MTRELYRPVENRNHRVWIIGIGIPLLAAALLIGGAGGAILAFTTARLLAAWLFSVRPYDPVMFLLAMVVLFAVILLASYLPARRAAKVDPMVALRCE